MQVWALCTPQPVSAIYKRQCLSESSAPQPLDLPASASRAVGGQETEVMPTVKLEKQKRDLNAVAEFIAEYRKKDIIGTTT